MVTKAQGITPSSSPAIGPSPRTLNALSAFCLRVIVALAKVFNSNALLPLEYLSVNLCSD